MRFATNPTWSQLSRTLFCILAHPAFFCPHGTSVLVDLLFSSPFLYLHTGMTINAFRSGEREQSRPPALSARLLLCLLSTTLLWVPP